MKLGSSLKNLHIYLRPFLIVIKLVPSRWCPYKNWIMFVLQAYKFRSFKNGNESEKSKMMLLSANRKISFWLTPMMYSGIKTQSKNK